MNDDGEGRGSALKTPFMTYTFSFVQVIIVLLQILGTKCIMEKGKNGDNMMLMIMHTVEGGVEMPCC